MYTGQLHEMHVHYKYIHSDHVKDAMIGCPFCLQILPFSPVDPKSFQLHFIKCAMRENFKEFKRNVGASNRLKLNFDCDECDVKFKFQYQVDNHKRIVHQGIIPTCNRCPDKTFDTENMYKSHATKCAASAHGSLPVKGKVSFFRA